MKPPPRWAPAAAAAVTALAWAPALAGKFLNWDDLPVVTANAALSLPAPDLLRWAFTSSHNATYQPLGWLAFAFVQALFGLRPIAFHAANLLLHSLSAALSCALAWRLLALARPSRAPGGHEAWSALFAALLFSLHPLQAELVCQASAVADLLALALALGAVLAYSYERGREALALAVGAGLSRWVGLEAALGVLALGLYRRRISRSALPLCAVAAAVALAAVWAKGARGYSSAGQPVSAWLAALDLFARKWAWPSDLMPYYLLNGGGAVGLAAGAAAFFSRRRFPALWPAWLFSAAALAPAALMSVEGRAYGHDRFAYLPCLAAALCAAGLLRSALESGRWRALAKGAAGALVLALFLAAPRAAFVWRDSQTLWRHAVAVDPREPMYYNRLGQALAAESGKPCEALKAFEAQLALEDSPEARSIAKEAAALCRAAK